MDNIQQIQKLTAELLQYCHDYYDHYNYCPYCGKKLEVKE